MCSVVRAHSLRTQQGMATIRGTSMSSYRPLGVTIEEAIADHAARVKAEAEQYGVFPRHLEVTSDFGEGVAGVGERWRAGKWRYCPNPKRCRAEMTVLRAKKKAQHGQAEGQKAH